MDGPSLPTVKRLFTLSGNECSFPKCSRRILDPASGTVLGEICHIRDRNSSSYRYSPREADDVIHGFENLILLCPEHHKLIDSCSDRFSVDALVSMKLDHERRHDVLRKDAALDDVARALLERLQPTALDYRLCILYKDAKDGRLRTSVIEHFEIGRPHALGEAVPIIVTAVNSHSAPAAPIDTQFRVFNYRTREWIAPSAELPVRPNLDARELVLVHANLVSEFGFESVDPYLILADSNPRWASSPNPTPAPAGWRRR